MLLWRRGLKKASVEKDVFQNLDLHIRSGEKVALMGPNGVGKTTLLKIIAGTLAQDEGEMMLGTGVKIGYYDQHQQNLSEKNTAQDEIWDAFHELTPQQSARHAGIVFIYRRRYRKKSGNVIRRRNAAGCLF